MADVPRPVRPPIPWRTIVATIAVAGAAYVGWLLVVALRREITWLVVAGFFAVVLSPLVDVLVHRAHIPRTVSAFIVFVLGFATVGGLGYLVIRPIVDEVSKFVSDVPHLVEQAQQGKGTIGQLVKKYNLVAEAQKYEPKIQSYVSSSGSKAVSIVKAIGNGVVSALSILVLTFLMLIEGPKILDGIVWLIEPSRRERARKLGRRASRAISGYMAGNILISIIAGLVTYTGLWIFGVPFRGVAALWVGFADLIPLIGATLGAVPTVGLAFLHSVTAGVGMIILYVVYQQFENHVLQVTIMARTVRLSPLAVLVSLLLGVQLFGLLGALLAIPAGGIVHVAVSDLLEERQRRRVALGLEEPAAPPGHAGNGHRIGGLRFGRRAKEGPEEPAAEGDVPGEPMA